jgi:hypothetical protein
MELSNLIGTEFHRCAEMVMQGKAPNPRCNRVAAMMKTFDSEWFSVTEVAPYQTEMKVWSDRYRYQGTLDLVAELNLVPTLIDFKSSARINDDMGMQLAAYAEAYKEITGVEIKQGLIVCVSKDKPHHKA